MMQPTNLLNRIQRTAALVAVVGIVLCALGFWLDQAQFFHSYWMAVIFWLGISLGCLIWLLVHFLAGGRWSLSIRRLLEAGTLLIAPMALLFVPVFFGMDLLFPWSIDAMVAEDAILQHKAPYLNDLFFWGRNLLYFVLWIGLALTLRRYSLREDNATSAEQPTISRRLRVLSGPGFLLYGITITFASVDWIMSMEPHWYSTIFGVLLASSQATTAISFAIIALAVLARHRPYVDVLTATHLSHLGNLLLTSVILASYMAFIQYLIIWSGNLPEEVVWYIARLEGGWRWVIYALLFFHFAIPFAVLLTRRVKQEIRRLAWVAALVLTANLVHLFWLIAPALHPADFTVHWMDFVAPVAVGGLWIAGFVWFVKRAPLMPRNDRVQIEEAHPHGRHEATA